MLGFILGAFVVFGGLMTADAIEQETGDGPKELTVSVVYEGTSTPVVDASITTNSQAYMGYSADVDENGQQTFNLLGGDWDVFVNAKWNNETQNQELVDWVYNDMPPVVEFAENDTGESIELVIEVVQITNRVIGKVVNENGEPLNAGIDLMAGMVGGYFGNTSDDGTFMINCNTGTFMMGVFFMDDEYYFTEKTITVTGSHTLENPYNLGTIVAKEKTSKITGYVKTADNKAVANIRINAFVVHGSGWAETQTDNDGYYEMYVNPGAWMMEVDRHNDTGDYVMSGDRPVVIVNSDNQTVSGQNITLIEADAEIFAMALDQKGNKAKIYGYVMCSEGESVGIKMDGPMGEEFGGELNNGEAEISVIGGKTYTCELFTPPDEGDYTVDGPVTVYVGASGEVDIEFYLKTMMHLFWFFI